MTTQIRHHRLHQQLQSHVHRGQRAARASPHTIAGLALSICFISSVRTAARITPEVFVRPGSVADIVRLLGALAGACEALLPPPLEAGEEATAPSKTATARPSPRVAQTTSAARGAKSPASRPSSAHPSQSHVEEGTGGAAAFSSRPASQHKAPPRDPLAGMTPPPADVSDPLTRMTWELDALKVRR